MSPEDRRAVYQQDWENVRYQDSLKWSRFKTISVIEGALLYAIYFTDKITYDLSVVLAVIASALVFIICAFAVKDNRDAWAHLDRAEILAGEGQMDVPRITKPAPFLGMRGRQWMFLGFWIVNLYNIAIIIEQIC